MLRRTFLIASRRIKARCYSTSQQRSEGLLINAAALAAALAAGLAGGATCYALLTPKAKPTSGITYASASELKQAIEDLHSIFESPDIIATDPGTLADYASASETTSYHPAAPHSVIVRVYSTEDVVKVVKLSNKWRVPIVPLSGGTSLEGHFDGYKGRPGSICLDMSGMDKILKINEADGDLVCQPGIQWETINESLKDEGIPLFFPLDPGPGATIGGMIATGCSGKWILANAVRYGTARAEWFLNVTVVLPSGDVIKTRSRARKSATGFDTTKLFIGSEGTLGIVTEATLRLAPLIPTKVAMAQFPDVEHAVSAVQEILNSPWGNHLQCIELLDDNMMSAISQSSSSSDTSTLPLKPHDTLYFKIQGSPPAISATASLIQDIASKHGSIKDSFAFAETEEAAEEMWRARKMALMSTLGWKQNGGGGEWRCWTTDVCVPTSRLPQLVSETKEDMAKVGITSTIVGHVGDGNFHALMLFRDENERQKVSEAVHRLVHRAIALDGTCTGEHGVGIGKKEYLSDELGEGTVELMRTIKQVIDPLNLFNPGKLYPEPRASTEAKKPKEY